MQAAGSVPLHYKNRIWILANAAFRFRSFLKLSLAIIFLERAHSLLENDYRALRRARQRRKMEEESATRLNLLRRLDLHWRCLRALAAVAKVFHSSRTFWRRLA